MHGRRGDHSVVCYLLTWRINCDYISIGTECKPCFTSLFETACRNAFQWRWSEVLEGILTCLPPPRPSLAENVRLYWRSVSQTIPSIFVSSNCDIFNNQTHHAYSPTMSVFHYGMIEVKLMNNICITVFFFSQRWERAGSFPLLFPHIDSDCFPSPLFVEWFDSFIPIASACLAAFIPSTEIITLVSRVMTFALSSQKGLPTHFKWSYGILDTGQISWMLYSVHDTCESKTWVPNVCPKYHQACGPLQNMEASSALRHCVSVIPIMPPSPLITAFSCSCAWSWLRAANTFTFLWINMQIDILQISTRGVTYVRRTANRHYIVDPSSKTTRFQHACPSFPPIFDGQIRNLQFVPWTGYKPSYRKIEMKENRYIKVN